MGTATPVKLRPSSPGCCEIGQFPSVEAGYAEVLDVGGMLLSTNVTSLSAPNSIFVLP
jgi:hypothetical protein